MRPRMYGSSDSHRFFTSTSPAAGCGSGALSSRKLSSRTSAAGRLARTMRWLEGGKALQVLVGVAELARQHGEAAEAVAHLQLLAHPHAAVELHRFLADMARGVGDLDLGRRDRA